MLLAIEHPLMSMAPSSLRIRHTGMSGGFFDDVFEFIGNAVQGLWDAAAAAINQVVQIIGNIVKLIVQVVAAAFGIISWEAVGETLGEIARGVGNVLVLINPARMIYDVLMESRLTRHSFMELDKFTGGLITTAVNVSDLVGRGMRGDPISKEELIRDALLILQVAIVVFTGGAGLAISSAIGGMVGREVCKHQADKQTCMQLISAASLAAGAYVGGATLNEISDTVLRSRITDVATLALVKECQRGDAIGDRECVFVGQIVRDYINTDPDTAGEWTTFLAREAAAIGVALLVEQAFPPKSPERQVLVQEIKQMPPEVLQMQLPPMEQKKSPVFFLLAAGAGALLFVGGLS